MKKINVVVFDFDGTISANDSSLAFAKYCFSNSIRPWFFLPVIWLSLVFKKINPKTIFWREVMRSFISQNMVKRFRKDFVKIYKRERFDWVESKIKEEKKKGNIVILISAGPDFLIKELVKDINFDAVITSVSNKISPWKYKFFCFANNKVVAFNLWAKKNKYLPNLVRSYSDSITDLPIMSLAKQQIWINPKTGDIVKIV